MTKDHFQPTDFINIVTKESTVHLKKKMCNYNSHL